MTRRSLPLAFYLNGLASALFFASIFVSRPSLHAALRWLGAAALLCAIVALIMTKQKPRQDANPSNGK